MVCTPLTITRIDFMLLAKLEPINHYRIAEPLKQSITDSCMPTQVELMQRKLIGWKMARAKRCPCCGYYMFSVHQDYLPRTTWLTYMCRNYACRKCKGKCKYAETVIERNNSH